MTPMNIAGIPQAEVEESSDQKYVFQIHIDRDDKMILLFKSYMKAAKEKQLKG